MALGAGARGWRARSARGMERGEQARGDRCEECGRSLGGDRGFVLACGDDMLAGWLEFECLS